MILALTSRKQAISQWNVFESMMKLYVARCNCVIELYISRWLCVYFITVRLLFQLIYVRLLWFANRSYFNATLYWQNNENCINKTTQTTASLLKCIYGRYFWNTYFYLSRERKTKKIIKQIEQMISIWSSSFV